MPFFDPLIDPKSFKQEFLKGDKKCVFYCESFEPNTTSYTSTMRGLQVGEDKARIIDNGRVTCAGNAMPDPQTMSKLQPFNFLDSTKRKFLAYKRELKDISQKMFATNAMSQISPRGDFAPATTYNSFKYFAPSNH